MKNWFEQYDQETFMMPYLAINYAKYNPLSSNAEHFTHNYNFELTVQQFKCFLAEYDEVEDLRKVYDPLATICIASVVKQLNMIKTVFETEGLLGITTEFVLYCEQILDFVHAEKFYMYTCIHML